MEDISKTSADNTRPENNIKIYHIQKKKFLDWYYNTGDDQSIREMRYDIGHEVIETLMTENKFCIDVETLFINCEQSEIPTNLCEEADSFEYDDMVFGELDEDYKLELI